MSTPKNRAKGVLGMQVEVTNGTENAAAGSDALIVYDLEMDPMDESTALERVPITPSQGKQTSVPGLTAGTCSFMQYIGGSGVAATAPPWDVPFRACGWDVTYVSVTSNTYTPSSEGAGGFDRAAAGTGLTHTIYWWADGHLKKLIGATGNCKWILTPGEPIKAEYEYKGAYLVNTETSVVTPSYPTAAEPPRAVSASITWTPSGGTAHTAVIRSLEFDLQRELVQRPDLNASSGVIAYTSPQRSPILTCVVERPTDITNADADGQNWEGVFTANTNGAISIGAIGSGAQQVINIDFPKAGLSGPPEIGEEDGIETYTLNFDLAMNAEATGDDEASIAVTS